MSTELYIAARKVAMRAGCDVPGATRTRRALLAVDTYAHAGGADDPGAALSEILADLLTDLRHLARVTGVDFEQVERDAVDSYREETGV